MDHDVAGGEDRPIGLGQPETIATDVAVDRGDPSSGHLVKGLAAGLLQLCSQPVEGVVLEQLLLDATGGRGALAVTHEQHEGAVGHAAQQPFDEGGAHEAGRTSNGDALARQRFGDHGGLFYHAHRDLSTTW